ncbi:hypothetical protein [Advenella alkanexedens]|uniref:hypothetical protein n=1 Tax=Advenella alkanexedens TaxID=1481665 RepID=UPI0026770148|nr:hypothetical protein [Advenella alkanexedens]WKU18658.1 hypothetical protein Q3V95_10130 [Advenella alkanexedens]
MSDYKHRQRELVKWRLDNIHECENCFKKTEREERWFLECPFLPSVKTSLLIGMRGKPRESDLSRSDI